MCFFMDTGSRSALRGLTFSSSIKDILNGFNRSIALRLLTEAFEKD